MSNSQILTVFRVNVKNVFFHCWYSDIPPEEHFKWLKLFQELSTLNNVKFPRCLTPSGTIGHPTLVIFCDASRLAFGACAYIRWKLFKGNFDVRFIAARSRVAPLKELTIPRLELQAAVLASRLGKTIISETRFAFEAIIYFSDSRVVLAWIKGQPRSYKPSVSTRISEIQSNSRPDEWFHCPTNDNVADDVTKGISTEEMKGRWLNGPEFLRLPTDHWPCNRARRAQHERGKQRTEKVRMTCAVAVPQPVIKYEDFSKWRRLLRVTAYVLRFCHNLRLKRTGINDEMTLDRLTAEEIEKAEVYWLKLAQTGLVKKMKDGELKSLTPFVDSKGIIRVGGRTDPSLVSIQQSTTASPPVQALDINTRNARRSSVSTFRCRHHHSKDTTTILSNRRTQRRQNRKASIYLLQGDAEKSSNPVDGQPTTPANAAVHSSVPIYSLRLLWSNNRPNQPKQDS